MMARAFDPGCLCRTVLILEGPEEWGKSSLVRALVPYPEWCAELTSNLETKDANLMIQGLWVAELAELHSLQRTEETRLKSFISACSDPHIPKYKSVRVAPKRRTVFVGTTNEDSYLKGLSGNTRYLPICLIEPINLERFAKIRDQIYAEAMCVYHDHPKNWWYMDATTHAIAAQERDKRRQINIYEDALKEWLNNKKSVTWREIAEQFLRLGSPADWKDKSLQMQITQALRAVGWSKHAGRKEGAKTNVWRPDQMFL